jgi:lipase
VTVRRVLLPGLTIPPDDYEELVALLPGQTVVLNTLVTPVTGTTIELRSAMTVPHEPYELVGHSIGALAALEWAAQSPAAVSRLVLLDPTDAYGTPVPVALGGTPGRVLVGVIGRLSRSRRIARTIGRWGRRTVLGMYGITTDPLPTTRIDELFGTRDGVAAAVVQVVGTPALVLRARALLDSAPMLPPIVIVTSQGGAASDHEATAMLAAMLGAELVDSPGGHLFPMTHPSETANLIARQSR